MLGDKIIKYIVQEIKSRYGSRQGLGKSLWHQWLYKTGKYNKYRNVDWSKIEKLVFVCKGNICRSAFAESVAKELGVEAISCGIHAISNAPADEQAIITAKALGYDLSRHKTTPVLNQTLTSRDLLVAMEPWQVEYLEGLFESGQTYTLLGIWIDPAQPYLHDPFGSQSEYFNRCFQAIEEAVRELKTRIEE